MIYFTFILECHKCFSGLSTTRQISLELQCLEINWNTKFNLKTQERTLTGPFWS